MVGMSQHQTLKLYAITRPMALWFRLTVIVVGFLLVMGVVQSNFVRPLWRAIGVIGPPQSYTAISFENPRDLPTELSGKQPTVTAAFMISNKTADPQNYAWAVSVVEGDTVRGSSSGNINVAAGQAALVSRQIKINCKPGQVKLMVSLIRPKEHIDAFMNCVS
jgi:hypothetical protein